MKKSIFNLSKIIALCLISIISIYSCQNEEELNECKTCNSQNYEIAKVDFMNSQFNFKKYNDSNSEIDLLYLNSSLSNVSDKLIELLNVKGINSNDVLGFNLITDCNEKTSNVYALKKENILGVIFYVKYNNSMVFKFFKGQKNIYLENELSNLKISTITSNHIFDVTNLFFNNTIISNFLFVDKNYKLIKNFNNEALNKQINKLYKRENRGLNMRGGGCASPCPSDSGMECGVNDSDEWFCRPHDDECGEDDQEQSLDESARYNYNLVQIKDDLYNFRDNYLIKNSGGQKIINDYYFLSKTLDINYHVLDKAVITFDLLKNDIVPMINELNNNPKGNFILINDALKNKIITYLTDIRPYYSDSVSKDKIDNLIEKTNFFANKTNFFVTNNLHLY